jgi:hypothetical protein
LSFKPSPYFPIYFPSVVACLVSAHATFPFFLDPSILPAHPLHAALSG